jgi:hypothetical protein
MSQGSSKDWILKSYDLPEPIYHFSIGSQQFYMLFINNIEGRSQ